MSPIAFSLMASDLRLAQGVASLAQGGRVLLSGCSNLLQLGLDFLELLRQALEDTVLLNDFEDGRVLFLLDRRQLHHHPHADHVPLREKQALVTGVDRLW
jgi:hypothetical protein